MMISQGKEAPKLSAQTRIRLDSSRLCHRGIGRSAVAFKVPIAVVLTTEHRSAREDMRNGAEPTKESAYANVCKIII
eukprot:m.118884 g.118884  ORF g.118884 m.118884 type:complete len:77 (-) comp13267_c0_seq2:916-1146(-)